MESSLLEGGGSSSHAVSFKYDSNFASGLKLSSKLEAALIKQEITVNLLEHLTDADWENVAKRCGEDVPYGQIVEARTLIQQRKLSRVPTVPTINILEKTKGCIGKLFDGDQGCGTLIFIGKALGLCAFHCVFEKTTRTVLESTLSVDGHGLELKFVNTTLDVAVYRIYDGHNVDREGPFIELERTDAVFAGNEVHLLSFPAFDSQSRDAEEDEPMLIYGRICRAELNRQSSLSVGQYNSFPNSSGGAVLSSNGRLIGMHLESLYHEDHEFYKPPPSPPLKGGLIFAAGGSLHIPLEEEKEESSTETEPSEDTSRLVKHALTNIKSKACLGLFLPVVLIKEELLKGGVFRKSKRMPQSKKQRKQLCQRKGGSPRRL